MKKTLLTLFLLFLPLFAMADTSLTFNPPPGDVSVIFLGNIFGIVDGVLHGTGSQIMGSMFGVFNAAVLALGGIVIMYTLIVGTMNTAHEGQMLGQKWSSIWIPVRSTIGLALLIPKASGYCLMQIFIMWVVVQGVGAADKIWNTALDYLNRGGVIIQAQMDSTTSLTAGGSDIADGAADILAGSVCMVGLQKQLENQRQSSLDTKDQYQSGQCYEPTSSDISKFCDTSVPDFLSTVNTVYYQNQRPGDTVFTLPMPYFEPGTIYYALNGICGSIHWNAISQDQLSSSNAPAGVGSDDLATASMSRAIAIQQMYTDLSSIARTMVLNDPQINTNSSNSTQFSSVANDQFGVPFLSSGSACTSADPLCTRWAGDPSSNTAPIFNGTEFQGAIADYNGIMMPTLNLMAQASADKTQTDSRAFIQQAQDSGWLLAGSYFFDLVWLNGRAAGPGANKTDSTADLKSSEFATSTMTSGFDTGGNCTGQYAILCNMFNQKQTKVNQVVTLIDGTGFLSTPLKVSVEPSGHDAESGASSSTVYGFINNSVLVQLPDQPGVKPPAFNIKFNVKASTSTLKFKTKKFPAGFMGIGWLMGNIFYNLIFVSIVQVVMDVISSLVLEIIYMFISIPLMQIGDIFELGVTIISLPGVNPIVALARMGTYYINFSMDLWITLLQYSALIGALGLMPLLAMIMPLLISWLGIMVSIGFITAYYIPFLPYMIFTFGTLAWFMAVIESMVAGPIVALGVTHPEGDGALGKGEQALMILMNVFLRPAMMVIGYIAGISLCYVSVWVINAGFQHVTQFMTGKAGEAVGYINWASVYAGFFCIVIYTMLYLTVVEKSFTLIHLLPDKVLRWIGGQQETLGADTSQWGQEVKGQMKETGDKTAGAGAQSSKAMEATTRKQLSKVGIGAESPAPEINVGNK
jgi:defect-in-organelle-trafficking protein DotA